MKFSSSFIFRVLGLLFALPLSHPAWTQTFQPVDAPLLSREVAFEQANEVYLYLTNPSGDTLHLKWRQLEMSLPDGWSIDLCDYGTCYTGVPANGVMNTVFDTIQPYLKLIVQPGTIPGTAWCWFRVQDADNSANFLDLYFSLFTPGITATTTPDPTAIKVFPNPARDFLVIDYRAAHAVPARLFEATGRTVWQKNIEPTSQNRIVTTDWPAGLYFLQIGNMTRQVVIDKQ